MSGYVKAAARANWPSYDDTDSDTQLAMEVSITEAVRAVLLHAASQAPNFDTDDWLRNEALAIWSNA